MSGGWGGVECSVEGVVRMEGVEGSTLSRTFVHSLMTFERHPSSKRNPPHPPPLNSIALSFDLLLHPIDVAVHLQPVITHLNTNITILPIPDIM